MDGTEAKQLLDPLARDAQDYEALNDGVAAVNGESDQREAPMSFRMRMIKTATMASLYVGLVSIWVLTNRDWLTSALMYCYYPSALDTADSYAVCWIHMRCYCKSV